MFATRTAYLAEDGRVFTVEHYPERRFPFFVTEHMDPNGARPDTDDCNVLGGACCVGYSCPFTNEDDLNQFLAENDLLEIQVMEK